MKKENVSFQLLKRREIMDYLDELKGKDLDAKGLEEAIVSLVAMGDQVVPVCLLRIKDCDEELLGILNLVIEMLGDESAIDPLLKMLSKPGLADINRVSILNLLCYFGFDPSDLPLEDMFDDFQGIAESSLEKLLNDIDKDDDTLQIILDEFCSYPQDFQFNLISELVEKKDNRAVKILALFANLAELDVAFAAVKGLGQFCSLEAAYALQKLAIEGAESIRALAAREQIRLRMNGVITDK